MVEAAYGAKDEPRHPRAWLAAFLSFLFPGLGQAYGGHRALAVILSAPVVGLILAVLAIWNGFGGPLRNSLLSSGFLFAVIAGNFALLCWRAFAISHAGLSRPIPDPHERRIAITSVAILIVLAIAMHAWVGVVVANLDNTLSQVFGGTLVPRVPLPEPSGSHEPVNVPQYRWDGTDRINVLLLGTDAYETREEVLTDVILVVSIDPVAGTAEMISVPRDTGFVPLPDESLYVGGLYPDKVNGLSTVASLDPETWCPDLVDDAEACGLRTIERSIGLYLGIEIHHYAIVDMAGFAELIDALGGIRLCLPGELHDPEFDGSLEQPRTSASRSCCRPAATSTTGSTRSPTRAAARAGSRCPTAHGSRSPTSPATSASRRCCSRCATSWHEADLIFELPAVLRAIGRTVSTDFPRDQAGDLASLLPVIAGPDIERVVLGYPEYVDLPTDPEVNYLLIPEARCHP